MGRAFLVVAVLVMVTASALTAQTNLRVRVESESRAPLSGALVALIDAGNQVIVERLSPSAGITVLMAPPGEYRVRVRRIGFRPFYTPPVTLPRSEELLIRVESPRVVLNAMVVSVSAQCGRINPDALTLAALWEEISKALRASQLTPGDLTEIAQMQTYRRETTVDGGIIVGDSAIRPISNGRPFGTPDLPSLTSAGYVRGNERNGWEYFGPDEAVLLSDGFASTHCFRAFREKKRPNQIGVAFEPAPKRRQSDIKGVIWINEATSELREVVFRFVNAGVLTRFEPGGYSRFLRMPSGAWIVSQWQLRMPILNMRMGSNSLVLTGFLENGGRVVVKPE